MPTVRILILCLLALLLASAATAGQVDVKAALAAIADRDFDGADQAVVLDHTDIRVEPSGLSHMTNLRVVKVLTGAGAANASFQRLDYDPATQAITVKHIIVHRADGSSEVQDLAGIEDVIAPAHAIYWGARMLGLDLPRLHPGDAVEIATYRKGFQIAYLANEPETMIDGGTPMSAARTFGAAEDESRFIPPMRGHFYDIVLFQETNPIVEKTYTLRTPRAMPVQYEVYNGEVKAAQRFDAEHFTYEFALRDVPAAKLEWRSTGLSDYAPKVVLATVEDWGAKSRWFHDANVDQFEVTPEIQAKVEEIIDGLQSDEARISAINHWVAQNIRYCGFSLGPKEGYTLHPGELIYHERAGVCKDIAGMSITMLRAAGYTVYPAMTMAGSRVEYTPADQFNHCVVALKNDDGTYKMLDPTWVPYSRYDWSRSEGEQHFVVGSPEGEDLDIIRSYTAEENGVVMKIDAKIDAGGTLHGRLFLDPSGNSDTRLRRAVGSNPIDRIEPDLRAWLASLGSSVELVKYEFGDPEDWAKPMTLSVEFAVPGYATVGERTLTFRPVGSRLVMANYARLFGYAGTGLAEERTTPALIWANGQVALTEKIELPKGFEAKAPEAVTAGAADSAGLCDFTWQADGRRLTFAGRLVAADRTITPEGWPDYRAAMSSFEEVGTTPVVIWKKGARS